MLARCEVVRVEELDDGWELVPVYRVVEADGEPAINWLPGLERDDPAGALDRGGFEEKTDARAFCCGVNWIRADAGLLEGTTTDDIDAERRNLDGAQWQTRGRPQPAQDDRPYQRTG